MPRNPNTPCVGCGRLCYPSKKTGHPDYQPPANHLCQGCRRDRRSSQPPTTEWRCRLCSTPASRQPTRGQRPTLCAECRPRGGGGFVSKTVRLSIYERDRWECGICTAPVDAKLIGTKDPARPSLDHLVPYSLGGSDHPENLRLAHLGCNVTRGNRVAA